MKKYRIILDPLSTGVSYDDKSTVTSIRIPSDSKSPLGRRIEKCVRLFRSRGLKPSLVSRELAVLASLVFVADIGISRESESQDGWTREIELVIPVQVPSRWSAVKKSLESLLLFLTGDIWSLEFNQAMPGELLPGDLGGGGAAKWSGVSLFSGGLDSFIGAVDSLEKGDRPLFLGHYWESLTCTYQTACADLLAEAYGISRQSFLRLRIGFGGTLFPGVEGEPTQRSRSFLFFALGIMAASTLAEGRTLTIPENGLIALNVPLDRLRLGAWSTRTAHPHYLNEFNAVLNKLGIEVELNNPFCFHTKGEMVAGCSRPDLLKDFHGATMSCSSPTKSRWHGGSPKHCGYCVPCIIRRASLSSIGDETDYSLDQLDARALDTGLAEGRDFRSFQVLAYRLSRTPSLAKFLVLKPGPIAKSDIEKWTSVFSRGIDEVAELLDAVQTKPR